MKTILYKLLFILAISPTIAFCSNNSPGEFSGRHTKEKKISKQYNVSPNALLKINNSYGNVDISTWNQNKVTIEVIIKTNGNDEQKVREKLDEINVEFQQTSSGVSAKTHFTRDNGSWWSSLFSSGSNVSMEINYIIKAPATNNVDISNDYGNIFLDKLQGNAKLSCDYGRIDVGELHGNNNQLNFDYSRNSHFGYINRGVINADYSEFTVDDARVLEISADYTNSKIKRVESLKFNCDYGSLTVDRVKKLVGNGDYLSTKIGEIFQTADLSFDYGSASIDRIMKGAGDIKINSDYTGFKIGYDRSHAFQFNINSNYGNVKGLENFEMNRRNEANTKRTYSGYHLNNSSTGSITIQTNYANISFHQQ